MMPSKELSPVCYKGEPLKSFTFPPGFNHRLSGVPDNPCSNFRFRIFVFLTYILVTQISQLFFTPSEQIQGTIDIGHDLTAGVNEAYFKHEWLAQVTQMVSAVILDFAFLFVSINWVIHTRNMRLFAAFLTFYGVRAFHLNIFKQEFPEGYYWRDPGMPSLVVKYGLFSDFFYSGHVGFLIICGLEMRKVGKHVVGTLLLLSSVFQAWVVITFRIHYTIDVTAGMIFAHYFYGVICYWEVKIDFALKKLQDLITCHRQQPQKIVIQNEMDLEKQIKH